MTFRQEEQDADRLSISGGPKSPSQDRDNDSTKQTLYGNPGIDPCHHINIQEPAVCLTMDKDLCQTMGSFLTAVPPSTLSGTRTC